MGEPKGGLPGWEQEVGEGPGRGVWCRGSEGEAGRRPRGWRLGAGHGKVSSRGWFMFSKLRLGSRDPYPLKQWLRRLWQDRGMWWGQGVSGPGWSQ